MRPIVLSALVAATSVILARGDVGDFAAIYAAILSTWCLAVDVRRHGWR